MQVVHNSISQLINLSIRIGKLFALHWQLIISLLNINNRRKNMKKITLTLIIILLMVIGANAQRYAYVDSEYILSNIPEYKDAQDYLNDLSVTWQSEIEAKFAEISRLYENFQNEAVLLPQELRKKREAEIVSKEQQIHELQQRKFGSEGELDQKRKELIQPIQEKVYNAISKIAVEKNYGFVFDKAAGLSILYTDPSLDISDDVLDVVGTLIQTVRREDRKR